MRGVYQWLHEAYRAGVGSSPLARGLLAHEIVLDEHVGIIPACAGFT